MHLPAHPAPQSSMAHGRHNITTTGDVIFSENEVVLFIDAVSWLQGWILDRADTAELVLEQDGVYYWKVEYWKVEYWKVESSATARIGQTDQ